MAQVAENLWHEDGGGVVVTATRGEIGFCPKHPDPGVWDAAHNPLYALWLKWHVKSSWCCGGRRNGGLLDALDALARIPSQRGLVELTKSVNARACLVRRYSFAVPWEGAIRAIVTASPRGVVEVGAGTGYWAKLLAAAGASHVVAIDRQDATYGLGLLRESQHRLRPHHFPVEAGTHHDVVEHAAKTLLLCWPDWADPWAAECLEAYRGDAVAYVGERGGCTADGRFEDILEDAWEEETRIPIPNWCGIHDRLTIFRRRL